jgi:phosphatidylinositol 4-kinase B
MAAQRKFVSSMAAYSVFCYVLHVKDRHNGNILLCQDGAIAHVDFGIMLNVRYAKDVLELKIKLSSEFVQVTPLVPRGQASKFCGARLRMPLVV